MHCSLSTFKVDLAMAVAATQQRVAADRREDAAPAERRRWRKKRGHRQVIWDAVQMPHNQIELYGQNNNGGRRP
jgi:hypothetical protein